MQFSGTVKHLEGSFSTLAAIYVLLDITDELHTGRVVYEIGLIWLRIGASGGLDTECHTYRE
jgi:hypothetical protein